MGKLNIMNKNFFFLKRHIKYYENNVHSVHPNIENVDKFAVKRNKEWTIKN